MRITCPTCSTQYDVDENDIAFIGQDVQCTECMTVWTQTRSGEASNPRLADELADDGEGIISDNVEVSEIEEPETEITEDVDVPAEDSSTLPTDEEAAEDEQDDNVVEPEDDEGIETDDDSLESEEAASDDDEDNPVWKEIAALAEKARTDSEAGIATDTEYSPPDDLPPIQSSPAVPSGGDPSVEATPEDDRPWDADAESDEDFSGFVWKDPSKENEPETKGDDSAAAHDADEPEFTPLADTSGGPLKEMDDDLIAAALNEQMAIEDALEDAPKPEERDISSVPVELGGPRARIPNVEALKKSVRTKSVQLTSEELQEQVPARRFRRGFTLVLLVFVILGAIYISRSTITEYMPAVGPYLETYATFVELLRVKAEVLGAYVWGLMMQGVDWVIAKFF
ncbi:MAG: hypothetical protein COA53_04995 [Rhodobacteraceae bacterium]|nr:MAG: hypothetical protein COA53_04995 [Paracoccaceae bacterium]